MQRSIGTHILQPFAAKANSPEEKENALKEAQDIINFQHRVFMKAGLAEVCALLEKLQSFSC